MNNINVGDARPVFSWRIEGAEREIRQENYRLLVRGEQGGTLWDSGCMDGTRRMSQPYGGEALHSGGRWSWEVIVAVRWTDENGAERRTTLSGGPVPFETGYFHFSDWKGVFIGETKDREYHLYRKTFTAGKPVRRAKLYVCGLGHFVGWLNGAPVSDHVLEPGWSDYDKTCFYTAYDVTGQVRQGDNALLFKLGDGMFNVPGGRYVYYERSYGKCKLLAQLELDYEDGGQELVVTDESWRRIASPVRFCCIYGGEDYDGRLWKKEYLLPEYREPTEDAKQGDSADSATKAKDGAQTAGGVAADEPRWENAVRVEPPKGTLRAMPMEPVKVQRRYTPVSCREAAPGVWLYDFGTNFSGWARIRVRTNGQAAGQTIELFPGEILDEKGRINQYITRGGCKWTYTCSGEREQEFAPDFTYTGFRYVEVRGARQRAAVAGGARQGAAVGAEGQSAPAEQALPVIEAFVGEFIYPEVETVGGFSCSNELYNVIHRIILQAIYSNTKSYFTDCPQREKLGWLEQTHLIGPSIMYNLDVHTLYAKVEQDMADAQRENGLVPDICPEYVTGFERWHRGFLDSPEWGSAVILNPWYVYLRYGDLSLARRFYGTMQRYLGYLGKMTHHEVLHHGLGDWLDIGPCAPHSQNTPVPVVATCIYHYDLAVMEKIARLLGRERDAEEYRRRREAVFAEYNAQFLDDQTGRYANGSQAAQAMSLIAGLVPPQMEARVAAELKNDVVKRGYAVTAGDIGHPFVVAALMKYGMSDVLAKMTAITKTPGYGYQVVNGATTLTEDWDGPAPAHPHGSQNHLMLGSIEEWFYGGLGGMELVRGGLPLGEVRICPQPVPEVDHVKAWTKHPYGRVAVEWTRGRDGEITVTAQIPPNVTAQLAAPDGRVLRTVGSGTYTYCFAEQE